MAEQQKKIVKKGFWAGLWEKLDKVMEEKAKSSPCCCSGQEKDGGKKCC